MHAGVDAGGPGQGVVFVNPTLHSEIGEEVGARTPMRSKGVNGKKNKTAPPVLGS